jgi:hypothetical protein
MLLYNDSPATLSAQEVMLYQLVTLNAELGHDLVFHLVLDGLQNDQLLRLGQHEIWKAKNDYNQGDQIGSIISVWTFVYFWAFFEKHDRNQIFCLFFIQLEIWLDSVWVIKNLCHPDND